MWGIYFCCDIIMVKGYVRYMITGFIVGKEESIIRIPRGRDCFCDLLAVIH